MLVRLLFSLKKTESQQLIISSGIWKNVISEKSFCFGLVFASRDMEVLILHPCYPRIPCAGVKVPSASIPFPPTCGALPQQTHRSLMATLHFSVTV